MAKDKSIQISCFTFVFKDRVFRGLAKVSNVLTPRIILGLIHFDCLIQLWLHFGIDKTFLQFHSKSKSRTLLPLALEPNSSIELLSDLLWNNKSKTDTTSVHFFSTLNKAKKFEQLTLVFPLDSQTSVFNLDLNVRFAILFVESVVNRDISILLCKFEGIWLDIH